MELLSKQVTGVQFAGDAYTVMLSKRSCKSNFLKVELFCHSHCHAIATLIQVELSQVELFPIENRREGMLMSARMFRK